MSSGEASVMASDEGSRTGPPEMRPAFLIAATINAKGNIDLATVRNGRVDAQARVEFSLGREGEVFQQRYWIEPSAPREEPEERRRGEREPIDMKFLAECLQGTLRELTPPLFRLTAPRAGAPRRFCASGEENDRARLRLLHDAFSLYLVAYEGYLA